MTFVDDTPTHAVGRNPLDEWSAFRRRPVTDNTQHSQQTAMHRAGFEPASPASERQQTHALDGAATGIGNTDV